MNSCEARKCPFWNGKICTDEVDYINALNGGLCCRYHPNAMLKEEYEEMINEIETDIFGYRKEDYKDGMPCDIQEQVFENY